LDGRVFPAELEESHQAQWDLIRDFLSAYAAHQPVRSVAVVGNAPLLPDAERAAAIDASDLVIRMNSLRMDEPDEPPCVGSTCHAVLLGRRTTVTPWVFKDYKRRAYLVPQMGFPLLQRIRPVPGYWPRDLGALPLPNGVVKKRLADQLDPGHQPGRLTPTSGTAMIYLGHDMFPGAQLIATGFSFLADTGQTGWSYHSGGSVPLGQFHYLDIEAALLRTWIGDGSLRFFE
jgi:hypothetical protein